MRTLIAALAVAALAAPAAAAPAPAGERPVLTLSGATFRPLPMAIAPFLFASATASRSAGQDLESALEQDLTVSGLFELLDRKSFLADPNEGATVQLIKFNRWQDVGAEALVKVVVDGGDPVRAEMRLFSPMTGKEELHAQASAPAAQARRIAHQFADAIFTFYTREPGAFQTRLSFVRKVKTIKQVFVADWDGRNATQLTSKSMNLLPAWMPGGDKLVFTSYKLGNPDLFVLDLRTQQTELLFKRTSKLVTGACPSRDGKRLAFAMSEDDGNSHIWIANIDGTQPKRLTDGYGINTSPSFSPDGSQIAFVSNRAGSPQIYLLAASGGAPKRLTFQGTYNQTPDWSPRGDLIAFTARDERNVFDLFTVDPATSKITRLTQGQGNNEEPTFSPNGRLIAFTSTRTGKSHLYVMSADGNFQRQMTSGSDDVYTPAWSPK